MVRLVSVHENNIRSVFWGYLLFASWEKWLLKGWGFEEVFWEWLLITSAKEWQFCWWVGWSNDLSTRDKCQAKEDCGLAIVEYDLNL